MVIFHSYVSLPEGNSTTKGPCLFIFPNQICQHLTNRRLPEAPELRWPWLSCSSLDLGIIIPLGKSTHVNHQAVLTEVGEAQGDMISWLMVDLPLWKIGKSIGKMTFPIYGKIKFMFQTTNQSVLSVYQFGRTIQSVQSFGFCHSHNTIQPENAV